MAPAGDVAMTDASLTSEIARSRDELDQPSVSARLLEPFTRQLLVEAGLGPGMRVLDVCSGAGEVALLAREIVGPGGHVTGFDPSAQAVAYASDRAVFRGFGNVEFVEAQLDDLPFGADFDAIVGRVVLAYRRDPVRDLRALGRCLRPSGLLVFQEFDHLSGRTIPPAPLVEEVRHWLIEAFERAGIELQMGPRLYAAFQSAGLPPPRMRLDGLIGGAESVAPMLMESVMRMLLPHLESLGVAMGQAVQVDTLEERIRLDLERTGGILQSSLLIGAWARMPG
jgi:ubiquinone/menaquinone biosynthesis C-methylase UbiE